MSYQFSLIRFVPDPARGEFVNIGAVAGDPEDRDWDIRFISDYRRAQALDSDGRLPAAIAFATSLGGRVDALEQLPESGPAPISHESLRQMAEEMQNLVQLTPPAPVVADSAELALDLVFDQMVVDPTRQRYRFKKKHPAQRSTREAYRAHGVPFDAIEQAAKISSGAYGDTFDFAVHNGHAVQLVQCWSFQLPNQDDLAERVKAWSWVVHELRQRGGLVRTGRGELEVPSDTEIAAVSIPPAEGSHAPAFAEAREAFRENGVRELTLEDADAVGEAAAELLAEAGISSSGT
jgi:hypothetical protein